MSAVDRSLERLIGWLTFAIGASAFQRNESVVFTAMQAVGGAPLWAMVFCLAGAVMVWSTVLTRSRIRLIVMAFLLLLWLMLLAVVAHSGPLGPVGSYGIVIVIYLIILMTRNLVIDDNYH